MLDRHAVQELLRAGLAPRAVAEQFGVSRRTIERIGCEAPVRDASPKSTVGRPRVDDAMRARVGALLLEDPERPPGEIARLLREEGTPLGLSTVYRVLAAVRATIPVSLLVRFEGVAGEYAQFDFGEGSVRLADGSRRVVHFAAYRLKFSRWVHVEVVPDEQVEALIRSLLASFDAAGGVPLRVVFDNPKTVVIRHDEGRPIWARRPEGRTRATLRRAHGAGATTGRSMSASSARCRATPRHATPRQRIVPRIE